MIARQHIPTFMDFDRAEAKANDLESVLDLPWVKSWADIENFHHFATSPYGVEWLLMAVMDDGKFWVVAYLNEEPNLPRLKL